MNYKSKFPKTDSRHWREKLTTRGSDELHARICFGGVQRWWPLKTANREQAALKARDVWLSLQTHGFEATEAKFKPWTIEQAKSDAETITVGGFIKAVTAVSTVRPVTLTTYTRKLRRLVSEICKIKGSKAKFDYCNGGANQWRDKVDNTALAELTPEKIKQWRTVFVNRHASNAIDRKSAQATAGSIIGNAKALFAPEVLMNLSIKLPSPLPFDGVNPNRPKTTRYNSKVNAPLLATLAYKELKAAKPEKFKIFLLAFGAGLRRSEIDRLTWKHFNWQDSTVSIETTEAGETKTADSADTIDIGADLLSYFKTAMAASKSAFVIESKAAPTAAPHWHRYRCDGHFKALLEWLQSHGVTARNPLHTLRKEFGSLINQKFGLYAASAALRHSNITMTSDTYVSKKERTALDIGELMAKEQAA